MKTRCAFGKCPALADTVRRIDLIASLRPDEQRPVFFLPSHKDAVLFDFSDRFGDGVNPACFGLPAFGPLDFGERVGDDFSESIFVFDC
jgi:hypothetical protein